MVDFDSPREERAYGDPKIDPRDVPDHGVPGDVVLDVPFVKQQTNRDCSEAVANMIHKWRGDHDMVIDLDDLKEGESLFYFYGLIEQVDGQLETGKPSAALDRVASLSNRKRQPVPIRLGKPRDGHSVLVVGVRYEETRFGGIRRKFVVHDPDIGSELEVSPTHLLSGDHGKHRFEFRGKFIDINPD